MVWRGGSADRLLVKTHINKKSKNINSKNLKIDFSLVSEYCALIWTEKWRQLFLRSEVLNQLNDPSNQL